MSTPRNRQTRYYNDKLQQEVIVSKPDNNLVVIVSFLVVIGIMAVFSATAQKAIEQGANPASYVLRQLLYLVVGIFGLRYFSKNDYKKLGKFAIPFSYVVIVFLALVDFTSMGVMANGATRWIMLGPLQFQPSELAKLSIIMLLSNAFYRDVNIFDPMKYKYYIPILIMVLLIFIQPNLSMLILLAATCVVMYLSAGGALGIFFAMVGAVIGAAFIFIKPYQLNRIKIWSNPESDPYGQGYNIIQSKLAFAAGGFWGVGYGNSKQKLAWLPEGHTDFIFAIIAEETGFIGCLLIIGLFFAFIHRGLIISSRCPDIYGKLMAIGITFTIGFQAFINMAVASSFFPATGVPLPFISYGGTSLVVTLCMTGVLLNISRKRIRRILSVEKY